MKARVVSKPTWSFSLTWASTASMRRCSASADKLSGCGSAVAGTAMRACCSDSTSSLTLALRRAARDLCQTPPSTQISAWAHVLCSSSHLTLFCKLTLRQLIGLSCTC